jgi:hypothetical protein
MPRALRMMRACTEAEANHNKGDAQDAVQEASLKSLPEAPNLSQASRITVNTALTRPRKEPARRS